MLFGFALIAFQNFFVVASIRFLTMVVELRCCYWRSGWWHQGFGKVYCRGHWAKNGRKYGLPCFDSYAVAQELIEFVKNGLNRLAVMDALIKDFDKEIVEAELTKKDSPTSTTEEDKEYLADSTPTESVSASLVGLLVFCFAVSKSGACIFMGFRVCCLRTRAFAAAWISGLSESCICLWEFLMFCDFRQFPIFALLRVRCVDACFSSCSC